MLLSRRCDCGALAGERGKKQQGKTRNEKTRNDETRNGKTWNESAPQVARTEEMHDHHPDIANAEQSIALRGGTKQAVPLRRGLKFTGSSLARFLESERPPEAQLNLPWERAVCQPADDTHPTADGGSGNPVVLDVEDVEELRTELDVDSLADLESLHQREVDLIERG